jgi:NADH-quinone oxidoreductase subunit L
MMMGLGVGAWTAAVFHIFTHAFFKCCLFLCAGSVSHTASHHSFDMKKDMGGIRSKMPVTFWTWIVSTAALCGVPFVSGFFSKDEIIDSARNNDYMVFYFVGIIGAFMTTAYMTRATYLTFFGEPRGAAAHFMGVEGHALPYGAEDETADAQTFAEQELDHDTPLHHGEPTRHGRPLPFAPNDSPWQITVPLLILSALALVAGYLNAAPFKWHWFEHWTESSIGLHFGEGIAAVPEPPEFSWANALPGLVLVALGFVLSWMISQAVFSGARNPFRPLVGLTERSRLARAGHTFLVQKYYLDHLYEKVIVYGIGHPIAQATYWTNQHIIDGIVNGAGRAGRKVGSLLYRYVDQGVVDGAVNASGYVASESGHALQPIQSGKINQYGALLFGGAMVGGIVLILLNV